ncbi:response regulator transcription factor [Desulfoscipio gibsoniae]|uniref:Stage 0 sporulation protein A homolog n=1 Tax=Desulfoscipio gibsoniae DSM 7213 TaxID=767817 RepID=R4KL76_9FIRM|nr:response regulator transcription factor [Desulfoscipio gibsoniae]AGL02327.1 response regulator with CheY-like receiver domain and winged-helix DNA-binding domain [Desulfoscipio gibsoniae DSM 7213]
MLKRILIIDDEPEMVELIEKYLKREGFQVITGNTGREAIRLAKSQKPDLIILDLIMPEMDGLEACQVLRRDSLTPILLISAKGDDTDKVLGLGLGADDYLTKPFSLNELVARVKAHLRRCDYAKKAAPDTGLDFIACGSLEINTRSHEVHMGGKPVILTSKEFELLYYMVQNANQVFNRETLYEKIWGYDSSGDSRTVMVHIRRLREKIEEDPNKPRYLKTIWGTGYKFCAN